MKKCKFCAEEVQDEAIKCKHCGSMLNEKDPALFDPSDASRAVTQGIKKKQLHDDFRKLWIGVIAVIAFIAGVGSHNGVIGWGILIVGAIVVNVWYYNE